MVATLAAFIPITVIQEFFLQQTLLLHRTYYGYKVIRPLSNLKIHQNQATPVRGQALSFCNLVESGQFLTMTNFICFYNTILYYKPPATFHQYIVLICNWPVTILRPFYSPKYILVITLINHGGVKNYIPHGWSENDPPSFPLTL